MTELTETLYNKDDELRVIRDNLQGFADMPLKSRERKILRLIKQYGDQRELEGRIDELRHVGAPHEAYETILYTDEESNIISLNDRINTLTTKKEKE